MVFWWALSVQRSAKPKTQALGRYPCFGKHEGRHEWRGANPDASGQESSRRASVCALRATSRKVCRRVFESISCAYDTNVTGCSYRKEQPSGSTQTDNRPACSPSRPLKECLKSGHQPSRNAPFPNLALPDCVDAESERTQFSCDSSVSPLIPGDLLSPVLRTGLGARPALPASTVAVPETTVYEYDESRLGKVEIGLAWQSRRLPAKTEAQRTQAFGNQSLGSRVLSPDGLHDLSSFGWAEDIRHIDASLRTRRM